MPESKVANQEASKLQEAAEDGNLELLKRLVQDLDDKNPPIGKTQIKGRKKILFVVQRSFSRYLRNQARSYRFFLKFCHVFLNLVI